MTDLLLAAGAGIATVASPCVLPILPILLGSSAANAAPRWRPLAIVGGFVSGFVALTLAFGASAEWLGLPAERVRQGAALMLLAAGLMMLWPRLGAWVFAPAGRVAERVQRWLPVQPAGPVGAGLLGLALGVLWAPCAGPVLASILALLAQAEAGQAAPLLVAYAAGAGVPMLAIAFGGRWVALRLQHVGRHAARLRQVFGVLVLASAAAFLSGRETALAAWLARGGPALPAAEAAPTPSLPAGTPAPELVGIDAWLNSAPLKLQALHGRVVLLDFWTFGCSNCINTLPSLRRWHQRYAARGLIVIGVHTPEFAHERPLAALRAAVERFDLRYPIAQDNGYATWNAYGIRYWPAQVLIDRSGRVVFRHYGEGDERLIEQRIEQLLAAQ